MAAEPRVVNPDEILQVLADTGPLSTRALAGRLGLAALDARVALLRLHTLELVRTTRRRRWAITDHGRAAISASRD